MATTNTTLTISAQIKGIANAVRDSLKLKGAMSGVGKASAASSKDLQKTLKVLQKELKQSAKDTKALTKYYDNQGKELKRLQKNYDALTASIKKTGAAKAAQAAPPPRRVGYGGYAGDVGIRAGIIGLSGPSMSGTAIGMGAGGIYNGYYGGGGGGGGYGRRARAKEERDKKRSFMQGFLQAFVPQSFIERKPGMFRQAAGNIVGGAVRNVGSAGITLVGSGLSGSDAAVNALATLGRTGGTLASGLQMSFGAARSEASAQQSFSSLLPYVRGKSGARALDLLNDLRSFAAPAGRKYGGLSANQSAALIGQMAAAGGGSASSYGEREMNEALSARSAYGIDVGVSGSLVRGAQIGASNTQGVSSLSKAIADAISLNLEGSEITNYVQGIAQNIERFGTTGIKVDTGAQGSIGRLLQAQGGYSGSRAAALSGGVSATLDSVAGDGPQNGGQFLLLQAAGYDPKNPESFYAAQEKIDNATPGEKAEIFARAQAMAKKGLSGMSRLAKGASYRQIAGQMGEQLRIGEAIKESQTTLSDQQTANALAAPMDGSPITSKLGTRNTFDSQRDTARMEDLDSLTGQKYLPQMLQMDAQARQTLNAMSEAGSGFMDFAADMQKFGSKLMSWSASHLGITTTGSPG